MSEKNFESLYKKLIKSKDYELFQRNKTKKSRPNIFKILGVQKKEDLTHSNFLAWIMNPEEKHNIGSSFLELFLLQFMTEQLHKLNLDKVNVFREYTGQSGRIDILIETKSAEGYACGEEGGFLTAIDTKLNEDLIKEGLARELVRSVQEARKKSGFDVSDRIVLGISGSEIVESAINDFREFIMTETLTVEWRTGIKNPTFREENNLDDASWTIEILKN